MLSAERYLFPNELSVTKTDIKQVLFVGSCMAMDYIRFFDGEYPETRIEYIEFNNLAELPLTSAENLQRFDFQVVQLPIRFILSDRIVNFHDFQDEATNEEIVRSARAALKISFENATKYNSQFGLLTFLATFIVPPTPAFAGLDNFGTHKDLAYIVRELNRDLIALAKSASNVLLIDCESIAGAIGKRYFFDDAIVFFGHGGFWFPDWNNNEVNRIEHCPPICDTSPSHLDQYMRSFWHQIIHHVRVFRQVDIVKLVIFDLDDTLWRGLIAENYQDDENRPMYFGWPLGISEAIHHLRARGILVAICSKNNEETVVRYWDKAAPAGWVKLEHFVTSEINWKTKSSNVSSIISRLSLTPKSVVFVDDNPVERASVEAANPGIRVIGSDPHSTRRILLAASETQVGTVTRESSAREKMLKQQIIRDHSRESMTRAEFLASLECRVTFFVIDNIGHPRAPRSYELLNKTNQFNTTGRRWTKQEIEFFFSSGGRAYCFEVTDRYTEYGLVGVVLYRDAEIIQYVMSCRVIGLDIEVAALEYIMTLDTSQTNGNFKALAIETELNLVSRDIFRKAGFAEVDGEAGVWVIQGFSPMAEKSHLRFSNGDASCIENSVV